MKFTFENGVEILLLNDPKNPEGLWLFAYYNKKPLNHGPTTISTDELPARLYWLKNYAGTYEIIVE